MTTVVVDASVALKWVVAEEDSDAAVGLGRHELWAPDLLRVECANALWAKARRGELSDAEAVERLRVLGTAAMTLVPQVDLLEDALRMALDLEHPVYDCLYLALAVRQDTQLVTADRRFVTAVLRNGKHRDWICLLSGSPNRW